jgi:hypothetical protein
MEDINKRKEEARKQTDDTVSGHGSCEMRPFGSRISNTSQYPHASRQEQAAALGPIEKRRPSGLLARRLIFAASES